MRRKRLRPTRLIALVVSLAALARAGAPEEREARRNYDAGVESYAAGRFSDAARQFSQADELAANDVALDQALRSAIKAELPALAMRLADRTEGRKGPGLAGLAKVARSRFAGEVGELAFACPERSKCRAVVDGEIVLEPRRLWVGRGTHSVAWIVDENETKQDVSVAAGALIRIEARGRATAVVADATKQPTGVGPKDSTAQVAPSGISNAYFWLALGATGVAGGLTLASGLDVLAKNRDYKTNPDPTLLAEGHDAERRTNILLGVTGGLAVTSVVLAFVVRWKSPSTAPRVSFGPRGVALTGEF